MFIIKTRITDNVEQLASMTADYFDREWVSINGFVEITIHNHKEGYYHDDPLRNGELGNEFVNLWLLLLLECAKNIYEYGYSAFREPETTNRWLEFKLLDGAVAINVAVNKEDTFNEWVIHKAHRGFVYVEPCDFEVSVDEFMVAVISATRKFLSELQIINLELMKTKMVSGLLRTLQEILPQPI